MDKGSDEPVGVSEAARPPSSKSGERPRFDNALVKPSDPSV
jgi:hypothetical protein